MADNIENLVLEQLRVIRNDIKDFRTRCELDALDIKQRLTTVERGVGIMRRESADIYEDHARQQVFIDRLSERLDRVERRLELNEQ